MDVEALSPFYIEKQESLAFDKFSKNGQLVDLHLVAKNIAFVIHVAATFDLNKYPPTAKLVYYSSPSEMEKEVEAVKSNTLEIITHVEDNGLKAAVEVKVGVLSSQHEGAFFRVKFMARDPVTGLLLEDYSQPIKVISKRSQIKKIMERKQQPQPQTPKQNDFNDRSPITNVTPAKRSQSTDVSETLARLEEQQRLQFDLLQQLVLQKTDPYQPIKRSVSIPDPDDMDFEAAFHRFLEAYQRVPTEERAKKIRRLNSSCDQNEALAEFVTLYSDTTAFVSKDCSASNKTCTCLDCPHKKELARFDSLYHDFWRIFQALN